MEMKENISNEEVHGDPHVSKFNVGVPEKKKKPILPIVIGVVAAFSLFVIIWVFFLKKSPINFVRDSQDYTVTEEIDPSNLAVNPLTGEQYANEDAEAWINERPLAVMVNNYIDARPQSGLVDADLVYEIVAEGGITRFLAFFLDTTPEKIGPVRSTRDYYLTLVKELGDAMIMHIGWSPQALEAIETWPVRSLGRGGGTFWRDNPRDVAIEHTAYTNGVELREIGRNLGWEGTREIDVWVFKEGSDKYNEYPEATDLSIDFWFEGDYSAIFKYNPENNSYLRSMGYDSEGNPVPHSDQETNEQIEVQNVIVQFVAESPVEGDDKNRLSYELIGSGTGLIFIDGRVVEATWTKETRDGRTTFYDTNGEQIQFNRGQFWISVVPDRNVEQVVFN